MSRRDAWRKILDAEVARWSEKSYDALRAELRDSQIYEVTSESQSFQVEVELLENNDAYLHVLVAVDDGSVPESFLPVSRSFICRKSTSGS